MSTLRVVVTRIQNVRPHANADAISIAEVGGWQTVIKKGQFRDGDLVVYFPPDAVIPQTVSDSLGVTQYLSKGRVRSIRLRGEVSHGFVVPVEPGDAEEDDVTDRYGATKYEPPAKVYGGGDIESDDALFPKYIDIENLRNFPNVFTPDDEVVVTEKIHGTNCRVGLVNGEWMAGSHNLRRKKPDNGETRTNLYWFPLSDEKMRLAIEEVAKFYNSVVVFCEVYGSRVQGHNFSYDAGNHLAYRVFDIIINGAYIDFENLSEFCDAQKLPLVPVVYRGKYDLEKIKSLASAPSLLGTMREGVVVKTITETTDTKIGRKILKYIGDDFLVKQSKNRDEGKEEVAH